jgi:hypothetical protein
VCGTCSVDDAWTSSSTWTGQGVRSVFCEAAMWEFGDIYVLEELLPAYPHLFIVLVKRIPITFFLNGSYEPEEGHTEVWRVSGCGR